MCVDLSTVAGVVGADELPWPERVAWLAAVRASPLLGKPPVLHLHDDRLLYLDRYWLEERQVCDDLLALLVSRPADELPAPPQAGGGTSHLWGRAPSERLFPAGFEEQREAAEIALSQAVTVLTGGPGTGKTTTVARLLALAAEQAELVGKIAASHRAGGADRQGGSAAARGGAA